MSRNRGLGPGFDCLRLLLSLSVVLFHSFQLAYGRSWSAGVFEPGVMLIVPTFFGLSGFLVAGSMVRVKSVPVFLFFRTLRILPALAMEITLSALILGPIVTSLPIRRYLLDPGLAVYFANLAGWIHYRLPGVFLGNALPDVVNGQLWTIPSELHCYLLLAACMLLRIATRRVVMLGVFVALAAAECLVGLLPGRHYDHGLFNSQEMLILCFLCGNVLFLWRDRIPSSRWLFAGAIAAYLGVYFAAPLLILLVGAVAATYIIAYLGMQRLPRIPLLMWGDYSYGIYLYSFALQQAVVWALPEHREWWVVLGIGGPASVLVAAFSWHCIEKPALRLRKLVAPKVALPLPKLADAASEVEAGAVGPKVAGG